MAYRPETGRAPERPEPTMTPEELDTLVASVTAERLRALALTAWGTVRHRGQTVVPVLALIEGLTTREGPEKRQVMVRLRNAIWATVQTMPGATFFESS